MSIADKLLTIANNTPEVCSILAPPKTVKGSVISVGDVSPIEHNLNVRCKSKNLFGKDVVTCLLSSGNPIYTWDDDAEGVTIYNGSTVTKGAGFQLNLSAGTYTFSSNNSYHVYLNDVNYYNATRKFGVIKSTKDFTLKFQAFLGAGLTSYRKPIMLVEGTYTEDTMPDYTSYISDFSGVNVSKYGKNLFDESKLISLGFTLQEDGRYYDYSTKSYVLWENIDAIKGSLNISAKIEYITGQGKGFEIRTTYTDGTFMWGNGITNSSKMVDKVQLVNAALRETWISNILITKDLSSDTEYEQYKEPQTATANADGNVDGFTSVSPNMTLISDTDSVVIECTYRSSDSSEANEKHTELQNAFANAKETVQKYLQSQGNKDG